MLSTDEKQDLIKQANELNKEIRTLRNDLLKINSQKEDLFQKKEVFKKQISGLISTAKSSRTERDQLTTSVKVSKEQRKELNDEVRNKIEEIKKFNKEKESITKKFGIIGDPSKIKAEMDNLNTVIEIEVMSFDKEKKIMKRIKELKKQYKETEKTSSVFEKVHILSKEIDKLKSKLDERHKKVQINAKTSQAKHEEMIEVGNQIDELRKSEKKAFDKFLDKKKDFNEINTKLQEKLVELAKLNNQLGSHKKERKQEKEAKKQHTLVEKQKLVQEKLKTGGKLTTEDILVLQSMNN